MKISKKNLAAFVRNHAYGEEIIHGGGKVETIKSIHVEFMLGMAVGEIRLVNGYKYTLIPVTFIPDEKTVIIESEEEFEKFINIFFSVQQRNSRHPNIPFKMTDYFENQIIVEVQGINPIDCKTLLAIKYGIITESFLVYI